MLPNSAVWLLVLYIHLLQGPIHALQPGDRLSRRKVFAFSAVPPGKYAYFLLNPAGRDQVGTNMTVILKAMLEYNSTCVCGMDLSDPRYGPKLGLR